MTEKARHAFGSESRIDAALQAGTIDAYDILFLDEGKVGWIDKNGNKVIAEPPKQVVNVQSLPSSGATSVVYIYSNKGYIWDGSQFVCLSADVSELEEDISSIEETMATKVDASTVDIKINDALQVIEF